MAATSDLAGIEVHRGFYRNFRATHWQVLQELALASKRRPLGNPDEVVEQPLEALYVTGHSLGGAMAVLFALTTAHEQLRGVYTFGQPMVISGSALPAAQAIDRRIFRHVLPQDPVPALPPAAWGAYAHVGREYHCSSKEWRLAPEPTRQVETIRDISRSLVTLLRPRPRRKPARFAIDAHPPHRYLDALRPAGRVTEFGD